MVRVWRGGRLTDHRKTCRRYNEPGHGHLLTLPPDGDSQDPARLPKTPQTVA